MATQVRQGAKLHVHLHHDVLTGDLTGVARVEGVGPMLPSEALEFLARTTRVEIQPVIDLADQISVNSYEHPEALKDRVHLSAGGDYFPYATRLTRHVDLDHPTPYDPDGPPGQTGTHNSGPLTRRHHRIRTHSGSPPNNSAPAATWRTPHGRELIVDHTGTHPHHGTRIRLDIAYEAA